MRHKSSMQPKKGVPYKRLVRDYTSSGANTSYPKELTKTEPIQTIGLIRFLAGALSFFLLDYSHTYIQFFLCLNEIHLHAYESFGFLVFDLRLPFGRADSARVFQKIAKTIRDAICIRNPDLFFQDSNLKKLKRFKYISINDSDRNNAVNYLDAQPVRQFNKTIG